MNQSAGFTTEDMNHSAEKHDKQPVIGHKIRTCIRKLFTIYNASHAQQTFCSTLKTTASDYSAEFIFYNLITVYSRLLHLRRLQTNNRHNHLETFCAFNSS